MWVRFPPRAHERSKWHGESAACAALAKNRVNNPSFSSSTIKLIAVLAMLIDHIGLLFFPEQLLWRVIGRLSFPLFALLIAEGFEKTGSVRKYFFRLLAFAAISQLPYAFFMAAAGVSPYHLNIFFTLASGLLVLILFKKTSPAIATVGAILLCAFTEWFGFDYGAYGVLLILCSSLLLRFRNSGTILITLLSFGNTMVGFFLGILSVQLFATMSVPIAYFYNRERGRHLFPRHFFYWFYPVHMLILLCIWLFVKA
ncbi:MAG: TraX family protein [bacterium]|nr:TraX family protein [bacterium]